jgi:hypothetical protein
MWLGALRMAAVATMALAVSCGAGNKYKPEPMPPRVQDGASDKRAAMRSAAPHQLQLEVEHERWNYEAAQQVKEAEQEKKAAAANKSASPPPPAKAAGIMGPPGAGSQPAAPTPAGATPQAPPAAAPARGN